MERSKSNAGSGSTEPVGKTKLIFYAKFFRRAKKNQAATSLTKHDNIFILQHKNSNIIENSHAGEISNKHI
jgi:hypothetical protein